MLVLLVLFTKTMIIKNGFLNYTTTDFIGIGIVFSFMVISSIVMWYHFFDKKPIVIINKTGIWTRGATHIPWERLAYYYFKQFKHKGMLTTFFYINTINPGEEHKISIAYSDKSYSDIINAIEENAKGFNVEYWGLIKEYNA